MYYKVLLLFLIFVFKLDVNCLFCQVDISVKKVSSSFVGTFVETIDLEIELLNRTKDSLFYYCYTSDRNEVFRDSSRIQVREFFSSNFIYLNRSFRNLTEVNFVHQIVGFNGASESNLMVVAVPPNTTLILMARQEFPRYIKTKGKERAMKDIRQVLIFRFFEKRDPVVDKMLKSASFVGIEHYPHQLAYRFRIFIQSGEINWKWMN